MTDNRHAVAFNTLSRVLNRNGYFVRLSVREEATRDMLAAVAQAQLTMQSEFLMTALNGEGIPNEVASRIWNRFMFGTPEGLASR